MAQKTAMYYEAKKIIKLKHGKKYTFINHYIKNSNRIVELKCNTHNKVFHVEYFDIIRHESNKCSNCFSEKQSIRKRNSSRHVKNLLLHSKDDFMKNNYYFLGLTDKQTNESTFYAEIKCNFHDLIFLQRNNEVGKHKACPECILKINNNALTASEIEKDTFERLNKIGKSFVKRFIYKGSKKIKHRIKVNLLCKKHDHPYPFWTFKNRINEKVCDRCNDRNRSLGVIKIEDFLINNKILFKDEYRFVNCKNVFTLPFDFYIKKCNLLIEFDGEQHFKPLTRFGGEKKFMEGIKRDIIKNKYSSMENINLLRIPFNQLNKIDTVLNEALAILKEGKTIHINYDKEIVNRYNDLYKNAKTLDIPMMLTPHSGDVDPSVDFGLKNEILTNLQFFSKTFSF